MARIVVCIEDEQAKQESDIYYHEIIQPGLTTASHEVEWATCSQVWDCMANHPPNILLLLVPRKHSCCWSIARQVRQQWGLRITPPSILVVVRWSPSDARDDPAYFCRPEHSSLYDDYYDGFRGVTWWIDHFLGKQRGQAQDNSTDELVTLSDSIDAFRYSDEKRTHLAQLLDQHGELIPYLYAIDGEGNVRLGQSGHHSYLVQGENVYGAGEMFFTLQQEIVRIDDQAGHYYGPVYRGRTFGQQFRDYLRHLLVNRYNLKVNDEVFRGTMQ